ADWRGITPMLALQAGRRELSRSTNHHLGPGEQRIVVTPELHVAKVCHPVCRDLPDVIADGEEECRERLAEFGPNITRVLMNTTSIQVNVFQPQRRHGTVARTCEHHEGDQSAIALLDIGIGWHLPNDVTHLFQRRHRPLASCCGYARLLLR